MSSADVVVAGTNAISNAYQGMIGAAADKKRRRMQALIGIGNSIEDTVQKIEAAKKRRTQEAESKALADAVALGAKSGDPSVILDTISPVQTTDPEVAEKKLQITLKVLGEKRQAEQNKASLNLQEREFKALQQDRAADNWRQTWQNFRVDQDRDAQRATNDENTKAQIKLREDEASAKRVELVRKDRAKYDAAQIVTLNSDLFTASYDREKNNGLSRADAFRERFEEQRKKMRDDSPEVIQAANETLEKLARMDRQDEAVKVRAEQREIEQTRANATPLLETLDRFATAAGGNIKGKLLPKQGQDDVPNDILGAVMALMENPVTKKLIKAGVDPEYLQSKIEAGIRKAIGAGKPEEDARETEARDKLMLTRYRTARGLNAVQPVNPKDFEAWKAEQEGQPKVDSKQSKPQTGEPAQTKTINGVTWVKTETGWKKQE